MLRKLLNWHLCGKCKREEKKNEISIVASHQKVESCIIRWITKLKVYYPVSISRYSCKFALDEMKIAVIARRE